MVNPFFSTDLVWDTDLRFSKVSRSPARTPSAARTGRWCTTAGAFPINERVLGKDSWLYGGQLGTNLTFGSVDFRLGAAYYDFTNVQSCDQPARRLAAERLHEAAAHRLPVTCTNMRTDGLTTLAGLASRYRLASNT